MKNTASVAAISMLLFALGAGAQDQPQPALTAERILDKNIEALGGRAVLGNVKSWAKKGSKTGSGIRITGINGLPATVSDSVEPSGQADFESYWKVPNRTLIIYNPGTNRESRSGFSGQVSWAVLHGKVVIFPNQPPRPGGPAAENYLDYVESRQKGAKVELKGIKKVAGRPAYKIESTWTDGTQAEDFYDTGSFLLLRREQRSPPRQTGQVIVLGDYSVSYSDYREVNGVKFAFETKPDAGGETRYTEIQVNPDLADTLFQPPVDSQPPTGKKK